MKALKLLLVVLMLSLGAKAQTTSWSPTPVPSAQTRLSTGSPQIRWIFGQHVYSIADSLAALKALIVASGGTVTSVAVTGTQGVSVASGSPITTHGTIALKGDTTYFTTKALIGNYQTKAQNIASYYPLSGNPSGFINNTGSTSGNAGTATKLATARTINGTAFDGTANITITASTPTSITFNTSGGAAAGSIFNGGSALTVSPVTIGAVPTSTTVNGSALTGNITITANTPNNVTFNTSGGAAAGTAFNGGSPITVSPVTIGAVPTSTTVNGSALTGNITITANTPNNITFNTSGGAAAGTTFNGGSPITVSPVTIGAQPQLSGTGFVKASGTTISYDNSTYLTANQTITLSGAVTGAGTTAITTTLASSVVGISNLSATGTPSSTTALFGDNTWKTISAGFTNPMTTPGDIIYGATAGAPTRLAIGGANTLLHGGSTAPSYSGVAIGDILATGTPSSTTVLFGNGTWGSIAVSGTTNYIARFNTSSSISNSSQIYDNGTDVLIGTTTDNGIKFDAVNIMRAQGGLGVGIVTNPVPFSYAGSTTGGTLAAATYYYKISAIDNNFMETTPSSEINAAVSSGTTGSVNIQWTAVTGAVSYRVYRGTAAGAETGYLTTSNTNFTDIGNSLTTGSVQTLNKTAVSWLLNDGSINGFKFGLGPGTNNSNNLVIGSGSALSHLTTGNTITSVGSNNLALCTTCAIVTALGYQDGQAITTGSQHILIGSQAGYGISTGQYDIFIGHSSGGGNTSFTVGIGSQAFQSTTGANNTGVGVNIGYYNTTGANNALYGYQTGMFYGGSTSNHTTAIDNSVMLGYQAQPLNNSDSNEDVVGYNAVGNGSNTATFGNTSITDTYLIGNLHLTTPGTGTIGTDLIAVYNTSTKVLKTISATSFAVARPAASRFSASTITLAYSTDYTFTGTTTTATLPAISGTSNSADYRIFIKNSGSGTVTINTAGGLNTLYDTSLTNTYALAAGSSITLTPDGTQWSR